MSARSAEYFRDVPMKSYDLLREGLTVLGFLALAVVVLAVVFGSPDYPPVRGRDVARLQPIAFLKTSAGILAGDSGIQNYGPPYTRDYDQAQNILGIAPANWLGVTKPLNPREDFVLKPLERVAVLNQAVAAALQTYKAAAPAQQQAWVKSYLAALSGASLVGDRVRVPAGDYGPVGVLMNGMLDLGRSGLLEGALESGAGVPYTMDFTRSLLFFQDDVDHSVAKTLDMLGEQWGISHETGPYPGAWWLWPYTFLYQIPPMSRSPSGDLQAAAIMTLVFLVLLFMPFIPVLNRLPRGLGIYKIIWRDWYARKG